MNMWLVFDQSDHSICDNYDLNTVSGRVCCVYIVFLRKKKRWILVLLKGSLVSRKEKRVLLG